MKNKLWFLTKTSLKKKMGSKWFIAVNIILCLAIVGFVNIDTIINKFGGDFDKKTEILVIDETNNFYPIFKEEYERNKELLGSMDNSEVILYENTIQDAKQEVKDDDKLLVIISSDEANYITVKLVSKSDIDAIIYQNINLSINNAKTAYALNISKIDVEELQKIYAAVTIEEEYLEEVQNLDSTMSMIMSTVFPIIILPFFMLTIFLVQMIGAEVNEEKTTRGMEIIISNVSPKTHFFSKVFAGNIFVISQGALLIIYLLLGFVVRHFTSGGSIGGEIGTLIGDVINQLNSAGILSNLAYIIPLTLLLMLANFLLYSILAGVLASMTTNMEDFQQLQTPIMLLSLAGYYLSVLAAVFKGSLFIKIASFIPFISPLVAPSLLFMGQISILDIIFSILISVGTVLILLKYGLKIYKVGILNYSSSKLWKKMFKAAKE